MRQNDSVVIVLTIFIEMDRWTKKVALVTGASAGIGAQIVITLAKKNMKVIATARRLNKLEELARNIKRDYNIDIYPLQCDVQKEEDILSVFKWANEKLGGVDVLINNAGVIYKEPIIEGSTANYHNILNINVVATAICSREMIHFIKQRNTSGHIINISSIAGHYAELIKLPTSVYAASKYAITGMAASLRNELTNSQLDVKVTNISPGVVETDMVLPFFQGQDISSIPSLLPQDIADMVINVLSMPHRVQICEVIMVPHKPLGNTNWLSQ